MSSFRARHAARPLVAAAGAAPARRAAEVIVVTHDPELERTLRAALPTAPIRVAATPAALADLLMTGDAGALVLDAGALDAAAIVVARHLAEQFPDVPLVAVGSREDEARLAGLISAGFVYRFLHRPLSAARARTFIDAALRRGGEIGSGAWPSTVRAPQPAAPRSGNLHALVLLVVGIATVVGVGAWLLFRPAAAPHVALEAPVVSPATRRQAPPPAAPAAIAGESVAGEAPVVNEPVSPAANDRATPAPAPETTPAVAHEEPTSPGEAQEAAPPSAALPDARPDPPVPPGPDPAAQTAEPLSPPPG